MENELRGFFGVGKWGHIETEAENAWLEGVNADANPYNQNTQKIEYYCWNNRWRLCNKWC